MCPRISSAHSARWARRCSRWSSSEFVAARPTFGNCQATHPVTKSELIREVAERIDMSPERTACVIDAILDQITRALQRGESVTLTGFGSFTPRRRNARTGRNPRTGAALEIPAHTTVPPLAV